MIDCGKRDLQVPRAVALIQAGGGQVVELVERQELDAAIPGQPADRGVVEAEGIDLGGDAKQ